MIAVGDTLWRSDSQSPAWFAHRVIKLTPARVVVDSNHFDGTRYEPPTVTIDRLALQRDGFAWSSAFHRRLYTASAKAEEIAARLALVDDAGDHTDGFDWPAVAADIRRHFHGLALTYHPDHGGTAEAFIEMHRSYERALSAAGDRELVSPKGFAALVAQVERTHAAEQAAGVVCQADPGTIGAWVAARRAHVVALRAEAWARAGVAA